MFNERIKNMNIKLVAFDMDGTLLDDNKNLPPEFVPWVKAHNNIKIVAASGRQYYTLRDNLAEIKDELIYVAENGSIVFENNKAIYTNALSKEAVRFCIKLISDIDGASPLLCGVNSAYISKDIKKAVIEQADIYYHRLKCCDDIIKEALDDDIVKIAIYIDDEKAEAFMDKFKKLPENLTSVLSGASWIDIANANVNKGAGIKAIQDKFNIDRKDCMAFGDYLNDMELLKSCEESYCMLNGHEKLKQIAKHIAPSNNEYGVMQVLKTVIS